MTGMNMLLSPVTARSLSDTAWAQFGVGEMAYTRPVMVEGQPAVAIFGADGEPIGGAPSEDLAVAAMIQHELEPMKLH